MKERAQREQLWSSGVVKSTRMAPRACQDCISMEEVNSIGKWVYIFVAGLEHMAVICIYTTSPILNHLQKGLQVQENGLLLDTSGS
jgi:hypothetical protein